MPTEHLMEGPRRLVRKVLVNRGLASVKRVMPRPWRHCRVVIRQHGFHSCHSALGPVPPQTNPGRRLRQVILEKQGC